MRVNRQRIILFAAVLAGVAGFLTQALWRSLSDYRYFELTDQQAIETWSVGLPGGFELVRYKSTPPGPQDGYRVFRPD